MPLGVPGIAGVHRRATIPRQPVTLSRDAVVIALVSSVSKTRVMVREITP